MIRTILGRNSAGTSPISKSQLSSRIIALSQCRAYAAIPNSNVAELKRTPLFDFHKQNGAKMVPFAGWEMPLSYGSVGQTTAHGHVRTQAGLFDVSHMLQHVFTGKSSLEFLSSLCPSSLTSLAPWSSTLSVLLNEEGGIIDDMIVTKHSEDGQGGQRFYVVTNAGRAEEDVAWITKKLEEWNSSEGKGKGREVKWEKLEGYGLVALQGPKAAETLQALTESDLTALKFGKAMYAKVDGVECHIARGGYTGEDGFEISIPPASAVSITSKLTSLPDVELIGLGARDSLRLEAGMCLYGHDLDETVSPIEAGLAWLVGKDRRAAGDFPGASRILKELKGGPERRRVGFQVTGSPAREGCEVLSNDGASIIGVITSGIPSPTLGQYIAMGYIKNGFHKKGTDVKIKVRRNVRDAVVVGMPFVPAKYYR